MKQMGQADGENVTRAVALVIVTKAVEDVGACQAVATREMQTMTFLSVADLSSTDYGIAVECSLCVCLSVVSTIKIL